MKVFEMPEIEVETFSVADVITTSGENDLPFVPTPNP